MQKKAAIKRKWEKIQQDIEDLKTECLNEITDDFMSENPDDKKLVKCFVNKIRNNGGFAGAYIEMVPLMTCTLHDEETVVGIPTDPARISKFIRKHREELERAGLFITRYGPNDRFIRIRVDERI